VGNHAVDANPGSAEAGVIPAVAAMRLDATTTMAVQRRLQRWLLPASARRTFEVWHPLPFRTSTPGAPIQWLKPSVNRIKPLRRELLRQPGSTHIGSRQQAP